MVVMRALQKLTEPELVRLAIDSEYRVNVMAEWIGCSDTSLRRHFVEVLCVLPCKWMQDLRLQKGLALVMADKSVKEAAGLAGYKSPSHFISSCRQKFKVTPGQAALGAEIHIEAPPVFASPRPKPSQPNVEKQKPKLQRVARRSKRKPAKRQFSKQKQTK